MGMTDTITITDTTLKWYRADYLAGVDTPLAARRYDYGNGECMQAYVCLRNKKWVAQLEHTRPGYGYRATTLYGEPARQVLAAIHAEQPEIIWEIWERSEAIG